MIWLGNEARPGLGITRLSFMGEREREREKEQRFKGYHCGLVPNTHLHDLGMGPAAYHRLLWLRLERLCFRKRKLSLLVGVVWDAPLSGRGGWERRPVR